jgi:hypothetical protein
MPSACGGHGVVADMRSRFCRKGLSVDDKTAKLCRIVIVLPAVTLPRPRKYQ